MCVFRNSRDLGKSLKLHVKHAFRCQLWIEDLHSKNCSVWEHVLSSALRVRLINQIYWHMLLILSSRWSWSICVSGILPLLLCSCLRASLQVLTSPGICLNFGLKLSIWIIKQSEKPGPFSVICVVLFFLFIRVWPSRAQYIYNHTRELTLLKPPCLSTMAPVSADLLTRPASVQNI